MIWFDASLESPADDGLLQSCIAAMLNISSENVDVVHSISDIKDALATCVVEAHSAESYSQLITLYLPETLPRPNVPEAAARLARTLDRSLLLANDETANPYSFIRVSKTGQCSVVLVDPDELDENDRYVIREPGRENDGTST
jgi:hypothetical protein